MTRCNKCKKLLLHTNTNFHKNIRSPSGLVYTCKYCVNLGRKLQHDITHKLRYGSMYSCARCKIVLPMTEQHFTRDKSTPTGFRYYCKKCNNELMRAYHKKEPWKFKLCRKLRQPEVNKYKRLRMKSDIKFKITTYLRTRLYTALKRKYVKKQLKIIELLSCSIDFLKHHLESKFQPGMSWSNYGKWHIDHIKPCASFDLLKLEQQRICFHYTNLQPLWAIDNIRKHNHV